MNSPHSPFTVDELKRYSRQLFLPEIGYQGQAALKNSTALIIGLGGLGSPCSLYLNASGIGQLILVDGDKVELSNLQRQVIHNTPNLKKLKTASAAETLTPLNPNTIIETIPHFFDEKIAHQVMRRVDIVLDCSDNFDTRYLINSLCIHYQKPLISASVIAFGGQLCCFDFHQNVSPCYACLFPQSEHHQPSENCNEVGVLSTAAGVLGVMQANEAVKMLIGLNTLTHRLLLIDTLTWQQRLIKIKADENCDCQKKHKP